MSNFIAPAEIYSHLHQEIVEAIDQEESGHLQFAIDAAVDEVKSYLNRYDTEAIFEAEGTDRHPLIWLYAKDIAVWHFIQLANPNVDMELRERRYELATAWLGKVQSGKVTPDLPLPIEEEDSQANDEVRHGNARRRNRGFL